MKVVADENIPLVSHYFGTNNELVLKSGRMITRDDLFDADILLVRSVTKVDELLLHNTPVKFVGSTTAGIDHLAIEWLDKTGIKWSAAAGCNAVAVAEYVVSVVAALQKQKLLHHSKLRAAVIGVGKVGNQVAEKLKILGFDVVLCDPLRAENEKDFFHTALEDLTDLDFISIHTPLTHQGKYPSHHLINSRFLQRQKKGCVLLNAGRGAVIDFYDLKKHVKHINACLDVWEHEPMIDADILRETLIATPHIAGYSLQSKYRGIQMVYDAALKENIFIHSIPYKKFPEKKISFQHAAVDWRDVVLKIYNPIETTLDMKNKLLGLDPTSVPRMFDHFRQQFADRYEFEYVLPEDVLLNDSDRLLLKQLGMQIHKC